MGHRRTAEKNLREIGWVELGAGVDVVPGEVIQNELV